MGENGDSVLKVVRLFIDNINESTKSTVKELDKLGDNVDDVKIKINTPPRNEELSAQIQEVEDKVDAITNSLVNLTNSIKTMTYNVRVVAAVLAFAIILASGITQYGKYIDNRDIKQEVDTYLETKQPRSEIDIKTNS